MITKTTGNLLRADTEALVNTVNTVGVMGKGIALQFRRAYPEMFAVYERACRNGEVELGRMHVWETGVLTGPRYIINFPTKKHWRSRSRLQDIESGLEDLIRVVGELGIRSIAVPPLGCGNGGLPWTSVEPLIKSAFANSPDIDVRVYPPDRPPQASEMTTATPKPKMTSGRAGLISLLGKYAESALGATPIEVQKLMYFLQVAGEPLRLKYKKGPYGPYADNLRHVLIAVEGHFLTGYGDGSSKVLEAEPIRVLPGVEEQAAEALEKHPETLERIEFVREIIDGFESMYGMELLSTVHWITLQDAGASSNWQRAAQLVQEWTDRKAKLFTEEHVRIAWNHLAELKINGIDHSETIVG